MNCTHTVKCTPTTMFPEVKRVVKKLLKGNSFLRHENDPNDCSCCGGSIENPSLAELQEPMKDPHFFTDFEVSKIYTWRFDKVKVYGVPIEPRSCTCEAQVNYIGKQFGRYFYGDVLLFKSKTHAETYIRQFRKTKELVLEEVQRLMRHNDAQRHAQRHAQMMLYHSKANEN